MGDKRGETEDKGRKEGKYKGGGRNSLTVPFPRERPATSGRQRGKEEFTGGKKKIWNNKKRDEGQRTALTEPGAPGRQPAMTHPRLPPAKRAET